MRQRIGEVAAGRPWCAEVVGIELLISIHRFTTATARITVLHVP
jgi:hypothetical protein